MTPRPASKDTPFKRLDRPHARRCASFQRLHHAGTRSRHWTNNVFRGRPFGRARVHQFTYAMDSLWLGRFPGLKPVAHVAKCARHEQRAAFPPTVIPSGGRSRSRGISRWEGTPRFPQPEGDSSTPVGMTVGVRSRLVTPCRHADAGSTSPVGRRCSDSAVLRIGKRSFLRQDDGARQSTRSSLVDRSRLPSLSTGLFESRAKRKPNRFRYSY